MAEPTQKEMIELEVRRGIENQIESYRKAMDSYSSNLEKAAERHASYLRTLTIYIVSAFTIVVIVAAFFYKYFLGESVETARAQITNEVSRLQPDLIKTAQAVVTNQVNVLAPDLIKAEVAKIEIVTLAKKDMKEALDIYRSQLVETGKLQLAVFATNQIPELTNTVISQVNAAKSQAVMDAQSAIDAKAKQDLTSKLHNALTASVEKFGNLSANQIRAFAQAVPVGTIVPFGGPTNAIPSDWLLCDGSIQQRSTLSNLFAVIGTSWGAGNSNTFNLPDLRGLFLRGVDLKSGNDPDATNRFSSFLSTNDIRGAVIGSYQLDAFQSHDHQTDGTPIPGGIHLGTKNNAFSGGGGSSFGYGGDMRTGFSGDSTETRPKNAYVNYIIKY
jgi:Phage Tail Collar Domain